MRMRIELTAVHWGQEELREARQCSPFVGTSKQLVEYSFSFCTSRAPVRKEKGDNMAEHESLEYGKADFVLLDTVSMEEFMANLKLR